MPLPATISHSRTRTRNHWMLGLAWTLSTAAQGCWEQAAARYSVNPALLVAIARTESGLNPLAINRNRNGSRDIGLMQINSRWLPSLAMHGISERDLLDPCTSIHVGAWVLAGNVQRLGNTWEAVGAYNARNPVLRHAYAQRVYRQLERASASAHPSRSVPATRPPGHHFVKASTP